MTSRESQTTVQRYGSGTRMVTARKTYECHSKREEELHLIGARSAPDCHDIKPGDACLLVYGGQDEFHPLRYCRPCADMIWADDKSKAGIQ